MLQGLDHAIALGTEGRMRNGTACLLELESKTACMLATLCGLSHKRTEDQMGNKVL